MLKKILLIFKIILFSQNIYSATTINFTKQLVVIYKVLDPLSVTVDIPEKMTVKAGKESFKYSDVISTKAPLNVKIEAPYNLRDEILDKIYGTATLVLKNQGEFTLTDLKNSTNTIKGRGFFPTEGDKAYQLILPLNDASAANKYQASTTINAMFNEELKEMVMGTYKGVLVLDVTYGG